MVAIMAVMTMPTMLSAQDNLCAHSKVQKNAMNAGNQCSWGNEEKIKKSSNRYYTHSIYTYIYRYVRLRLLIMGKKDDSTANLPVILNFNKEKVDCFKSRHSGATSILLTKFMKCM